MILFALHTLEQPTRWLAGWSDNEPVWTNRWLDALAMPEDETRAERTLLARHTGLPRQAFASRGVGVLNI